MSSSPDPAPSTASKSDVLTSRNIIKIVSDYGEAIRRGNLQEQMDKFLEIWRELERLDEAIAS